MNRTLAATVVVIVAAATMFCAAVASAQPQPGFVQLNLREGVTLRTLIDLVGERHGINFIYTDDIGNREVTIRAPNQIPVDSLPSLLGSILRMQQLALVDADVPGWKQIIDSRDMLNMADAGEASDVLQEKGPAAPVTQVFLLKHASPTEIQTTVRAFLSKGTGGTGGANVLAMPESKSLIVTDFAPVVQTIAKLIELIDQPGAPLTEELYTVEHLPADQLAETVQTILNQPTGGQVARAGTGAVFLSSEPRTNQIVVVGPPPLVDKAMQLLKRFDVSLGMQTKVFRFTNMQAERFDRLAQGALSDEDQRLYLSSIDVEGNLLIVRAPQEILDTVEDLRTQVDVPVQLTQSPIRFYKLKNANALDVLYTLLSLQEVTGTQVTTVQSSGMGSMGSQIPAAGLQPSSPGQVPPTLLNQAMPRRDSNQGGRPPLETMQLPLSPQPGRAQPYDELRESRVDRLSAVSGSMGMTGSLPGNARVSADPSTNSIVIAAPPETQEMYRNLIEELDRRRPQVLVDAKIVAIDTSNNFQLGVEVLFGERSISEPAIAFTRFGLGEVDTSDNTLRLLRMAATGNAGFNGTLVAPEVADYILNALSRHQRARVLSAPRIVVNDNSTGQLESVRSVPFGSVNASDTVATTSLGGNQQAGTIITVTPHINEREHLLLEFEVEFSDFLGEFSGDPQALPPPRVIDRVGSVVTIPSGHTVIVGGLNRTSHNDDFTGVPFLEKIPILRELSSSISESSATTSFFLFIRPVILYDDKFEDFKYFSERATLDARIQGEHPITVPTIMEPDAYRYVP